MRRSSWRTQRGRLRETPAPAPDPESVAPRARWSPSSPEPRLPLRAERLVGLAVVRVLHQAGLDVGFVGKRALEIEVGLVIERALGDRDRVAGAARQLLGQLGRFREHALLLLHAVVE